MKVLKEVVLKEATWFESVICQLDSQSCKFGSVRCIFEIKYGKMSYLKVNSKIKH